MVYISFTKGFKDNQTNKKIQLTKWNSEEIDFDKLFFFYQEEILILICDV